MEKMKAGSQRAKWYSRGIALFHYFVSIAGKITNIISPYRWVYHASVGLLDKGTIGVELENRSPNNSNPITGPQYEAMGDILEYLYTDDFPIEHLISHNEMKKRFGKTGKGKVCPGPGFDWSEFETRFGSRFDLEKIGSEYYKVGGGNGR